MASNSYAVNSLFKRRPNPQRTENTAITQLKKKYGEITLLDFPQLTKDMYPGVPVMDLWSSLFGDINDDSMFTKIERNNTLRPGEFDPSSASAKNYLDKLVSNMVSTGIKVTHISNNAPRNLADADNLLRQEGIRVGKAWLDAADDVLRVLPPEELEMLKTHLVSGLIEQKIFRKFRFLGKFHLVAVDGTGMATFEQRHCDHCLTKISKAGVVTYFHYVLEAKIVTSTGMSISLASEFIENAPGRDYEKQDCEQKAFVRLAAKIKKHFPRLPICILGDGLYPNNTVFDICAKNNWLLIITLKDGNLKNLSNRSRFIKGNRPEAKRLHGKQNLPNNF